MTINGTRQQAGGRHADCSGPYVCPFPETDRYPAGSRWACPGCGARYKLTRPQQPRWWRNWSTPSGYWRLIFADQAALARAGGRWTPRNPAPAHATWKDAIKNPGPEPSQLLALLLSPVGHLLGYGFCLRCRVSWLLGRPHETAYVGGGCFPLCERCWHQLGTPGRRMPYYRRLVTDYWHDDAKWPAIEAGVLSEGRSA